MPDELNKLLDTAIDREINSRALYLAGEKVAGDPAAKALMKELADEEMKHTEYLKKIKEGGLKKSSRRREEEIPNLKISQYLEGGEKLEGAGVQDTLIYAIRHEHQAVEFYSKLMGAVTGEEAKKLCERLVHEELKHKLKLEMLYDDMVFMED